MKVAEIVIGEDKETISLSEHTFNTGNTGFVGRGIIYVKGEGHTVYIQIAKFKKKKE